MSSELAPALHPLLRRAARIEAITVREQQIARLQAEQRREVAALYAEDRAGMSERFVVDELACAWHRSTRQAQARLDQARMFCAFPCLGALVADGTWLLDHADAVLGELLACGLTEAEQQQVLDLLLSRQVRRTPYELRLAVRTAVLVLFPDHAARRAAKARRDRDVSTHVDSPGSAQLYAHGPVADIAAMMASLDALCWPPAPDDPRTMAQRRFDTLRELVCGQARPGQWQAQLLVDLLTLDGHDELPGEIVGFGPVPAPVARELVTGADLRRVVVDDHGRLVTVDPVVHHPDQAQPSPLPTGPQCWAHEDVVEEPVEPDPGAPTAADLAWHAEHLQHQPPADPEHTDHRADPSVPTAARPRPAQATPDAPQRPHRPPVQADAGTGSHDGVEHEAELEVERDTGSTQPAPSPTPTPSWWTVNAFTAALRRLRTDPLRTVDLSTDRYQTPTRLKRHLILRDRTCVFPGCTRRADTCDKDHLLEWPRGRTSEPNLADECEHHHQARHDRFTVQRLPDGTFRWTTPAGHTYDRPPRPVLDNFRHPRPPDNEAPGPDSPTTT